MLVLLALVGGWGNTAYVTALVQGDVVRVMLLFYLLPAWSVLGGRVFLGERISLRRGSAVALAMSGAFLVVGGFAAFDAPLSLADVMAVTAGLAFAGNNIIARQSQEIPTASKTVVAGSAVSLVVEAAGLAPLAYEWKKGTATLSGKTAAVLTFSSVQSADAGSYTVVVTNGAGAVTSAVAVLTVTPIVQITSAPANVVIVANDRAQLNVVAAECRGP